jgi:hypothetical protein
MIPKCFMISNVNETAKSIDYKLILSYRLLHFDEALSMALRCNVYHYKQQCMYELIHEVAS